MLGMTESLCGVQIYSSNLHIMTSSGGGPLEFDNIQEIVAIELMFEVILHVFLLFFVFLSHSKLSEKRKPTINRRKY